MDAANGEFDPQDQAEVFDETHLDDEGQGDIDFEDMDPVIDVTRDHNDFERLGTERTKAEEQDALNRARIEAQANELLGQSGDAAEAEDAETDTSAPDEIELVYTGLMRNQRGAQASAAHWEAKRLSDEDISELGYGPNSEEPR
jgi:hypothetical protein